MNGYNYENSADQYKLITKRKGEKTKESTFFQDRSLLEIAVRSLPLEEMQSIKVEQWVQEAHRESSLVIEINNVTKDYVETFYKLSGE